VPGEENKGKMIKHVCLREEPRTQMKKIGKYLRGMAKPDRSNPAIDQIIRKSNNIKKLSFLKKRR
jgi:hypothetical protein